MHGESLRSRRHFFPLRNCQHVQWQAEGKGRLSKSIATQTVRLIDSNSKNEKKIIEKYLCVFDVNTSMKLWSVFR